MPGTNGNNSRQKFPAIQSGINADPAAVARVELNGQGRADMDLRLTRIAVLQRAIADGTYSVPAGAVAEKVVERLLHRPEAAPSDVKLGRCQSRDAS